MSTAAIPGQRQGRNEKGLLRDLKDLHPGCSPARMVGHLRQAVNASPNYLRVAQVQYRNASSITSSSSTPSGRSSATSSRSPRPRTRNWARASD